MNILKQSQVYAKRKKFKNKIMLHFSSNLALSYNKTLQKLIRKRSKMNITGINWSSGDALMST